MKRLALSLVLLLAPLSASAQAAGEDPNGPRPIAMRPTVWIDEMTWMELRDAVQMGKTTAIIPTGGTEPNGPFSVEGKHSFIVRSDAEAIAERLGNALIAPVIWFEPGGDPAPATLPAGELPGQFAIRTTVYKDVLKDVASSLRQFGFKDIILFGDNGGNQTPMSQVATELNQAWGAANAARAHHIPEYYAQHGVIDDLLPSWGINQGDGGVHDSYRVTATLMALDVNYVRLEERIAAGKTEINGISIVPVINVIEHARRMQEMKTIATVQAIRKATAVRATEQR